MTKEIFSIWLIPSDIDGGNISKSIQSLSKKYLAPIFNPHCTIFSPILDLNKAQTIINQLDQKEFQVNVKSIDESDDIWKTVFWIEQTKTIILLILSMITFAHFI